MLCFGIASVFFGIQLWIRSGGGGPASMFGFGGNAGSAQIPVIDAHVEVPLQLVFDGGAIDVRLPDGRQTICSACSGSGAAPGHSSSCPHCGGQGHALRRVQLMPGFVQNMRHECPHCRGSGVLVTRSCQRCEGRKVVLDRAATVRVAVPAGCPENHVVVWVWWRESV